MVNKGGDDELDHLIWDGNETWLVLWRRFVCGLLAYVAIMLSSVYADHFDAFTRSFAVLPFEYRWRDDAVETLPGTLLWRIICCGHAGYCLGCVQGIEIADRLCWRLTGWHIFTADRSAVVVGYALLGATWIIENRR
jgi:hypothetical protein